MQARIRTGAPPGPRKAERPTLPGRPLEEICRTNSIGEKATTCLQRARWLTFLDSFRPLRLVRRWWGVPA